jgi:pimeloyl-ACP methyl ester carboxylesterase
MRLAVDALATRFRVMTFSLADEPTSGAAFDDRAGFDSYVRQVADALDAAGVQSAIVCGISYGGLIAATFAARHPDRTQAVVVVSAIPPSWKPDARVRFLMRAPGLFSPLFCINSLRLFPEMVAAKENARSAVSFALRHLATVVSHRFSPGLMARRIRLLEGNSLEAELTQVRVPTLVVTGQPDLDRVVPVAWTREYLRLWPDSRFASIARSGHLGCITRADEFADLIARFAEKMSRPHDQRRRVVG